MGCKTCVSRNDAFRRLCLKTKHSLTVFDAGVNPHLDNLKGDLSKMTMEEYCKTCGALRVVSYFKTGEAKAVNCSKCRGSEWITLQEFIQITMLAIHLFKIDATPILVPTKSCNRHQDCDEATKNWLTSHPGEIFTPMDFHCHNDECEECFGN